MNRTARIQTWAGVAAIAALPPLYLGATNELFPVTVLGLVVFTAGMLITPVLRFLPAPKEASSSGTSSRASGSASGEGPGGASGEASGEASSEAGPPESQQAGHASDESPGSTQPAPQPHEK